MDKPADPATPLREVYQHFIAVLIGNRWDPQTCRPHRATTLASPGMT